MLVTLTGSQNSLHSDVVYAPEPTNNARSISSNNNNNNSNHDDDDDDMADKDIHGSQFEDAYELPQLPGKKGSKFLEFVPNSENLPEPEDLSASNR